MSTNQSTPIFARAALLGAPEFFKSRTGKRATTLIVLLSLLQACGIPDLKPFSDATAEMSTQLGSAFEKTQAAIGYAADTASENQDFKKKSKELEERWVLTRAAIAALVEYSDSLAALSEAGKKGKETVARLTGAVQNLFSAVSALPGASTAVNIINTVGGKIIEMQAASDIRKAVRNATEAVDLMAPLLKANFIDLRRIHALATNAWQSHVDGESSILVNYYEALLPEERRIQYLLTLIVGFQSATDRLLFEAAQATGKENVEEAKTLTDKIPLARAENLKVLGSFDRTMSGLDPATADAKVEIRQMQLMALLNAQRKEIALLEPKYKAAIARLENVKESRQLGSRVMAKAIESIDAWKKAHKSLQAVAEGQQRRPSIAELVSILKEIPALVK